MNAMLGQVEQDRVSQILGTGFVRFVSPCGMEGLVKEVNGELVILAVAARLPGTGQFRAFIKQAKEQYGSIAILDVMNDDLRPILRRYQFTPALELFEGETMEVWRWKP